MLSVLRVGVPHLALPLNLLLQRHKAHNETIPKCRFAEKPCAASIFAKRKRLIVSNTFVSKLSTLFGPSAEIRTRGLLNPIQARYQTSPHPDTARILSARI